MNYKYEWKLKKMCKDYFKIENYEKALADDFKGWVVHHRHRVYTNISKEAA